MNKIKLQVGVARTIADLNGMDNIQPSYLKEAINYRNLDRGDWGE